MQIYFFLNVFISEHLYYMASHGRNQGLILEFAPLPISDTKHWWVQRHIFAAKLKKSGRWPDNAYLNTTHTV